ncbi:MAG: gamma-glutamylcyclotransferase [Gemmatimonadales bacterium]
MGLAVVRPATLRPRRAEPAGGRRTPPLIFFYGTLMTPFNRPGRRRIDSHLVFKGGGTIAAALFDLGIYPAAVPAEHEIARVRGEVYEMTAAPAVLAVLDEIEGYSPNEPDTSLYTRLVTPVTLDDGGGVDAWAYFYNAPLGGAQRIPSGDYLEYLKAR